MFAVGGSLVVAKKTPALELYDVSDGNLSIKMGVRLAGGVTELTACRAVERPGYLLVVVLEQMLCIFALAETRRLVSVSNCKLSTPPWYCFHSKSFAVSENNRYIALGLWGSLFGLVKFDKFGYIRAIFEGHGHFSNVLDVVFLKDFNNKTVLAVLGCNEKNKAKIVLTYELSDAGQLLPGPWRLDSVLEFRPCF